MHWDPALYETSHSYVWKFGEDLLEWLQPQPGERILDVGCGTGSLTARIAQAGALVSGIDASPQMVEQARGQCPGVHFEVADIRSYETSEPFDAVFSNAVLHWVRPPATAAARIYAALRPGGRFVAEFGGQGNIRSLIDAARDILGGPEADETAWYFPSIAEYAAVLEGAGFEVRHALLFDRPTPQDPGDGGLRSWLSMFGAPILNAAPPDLLDEALQSLEESLRPRCFNDGRWMIDYRRLRVEAVRR